MATSEASVTNFSRSRHTDLLPLTTGQTGRDRPSSIASPYDAQSSDVSTPLDSAVSLASPTLLAVRQYYRDNGLSTAFQANQAIRRRSIPQTPQDSVRRPSSISSPGGLAARFGGVSVSSPLGKVATFTDATPVTSIAEETRKQLLVGLSEGELVQLGSAVARRRSSIQTDIITQASGLVPFKWTHENLRQWGQVYLGNAETADAFVKALHQRKPEGVDETKQKTPGKDHDGSSCKRDSIVIRARVIPKLKSRKPFLIQRKFDLEGLRASVYSPDIESTGEEKAEDSTAGVKHKIDDKVIRKKNIAADIDVNARCLRSGSVSSEKPVDHGPSNKDRAYPSLEKLGGSPSRRIMPIHIEYALHYLPVLAALMLSGHVKKGDAIDLPLPHPEAWNETVAYIYTGKREVTEAMRENILHLAGRIE